MNIYSKNVYKIKEISYIKHVLIIYNISENHYIGLPCYNYEVENCLYIDSINKYINIEDLHEYSRKNIKRINIFKREKIENE